VKRPLVVAALLLVAAAAGTAARLALRAPRVRPHITVLLWDTTRADRLSAYGYSRETTPWLRALAARGVLFEQCRAPAPWTVPSHASLFTGLLPNAHGCLDLQSPLAPAHVTLAERLRDAGYDTILVSNNSAVGPITGLAQGFERTRMVCLETDPPRRPSAKVTREILEEELDLRAADPARAAKPLFLFVNYMEPHLPYAPPNLIEAPWRPEGALEEEVLRARRIEFPEDILHNLGIRPLDARTLGILSSLYDADVRDLDDHCAGVEKVLAGAGLLPEGPGGVLVVTSDHGENLGEHGLLDHKLSLADTLLRIPLVVRWPGRLDGGRRVKEAVRLQDLFPTLLEAAGIPADPSATPHAASLLGGRVPDSAQVSELPAPLAFLPGLKALPPFAARPDSDFEPMRIEILAATAPLEGGRRLKWERRRRKADAGPAKDLGERLYDLAADPGEERDLLGAKPPAPADVEAARRLAALAEAWTAPAK
jgi:arylsulfatase A-like enzyme